MAFSIILALLAPLAVAAPGPPLRKLEDRQVPDSFDWASIEPSPRLEYHDCYDDAKCARLLLPLDWSKTNGSASTGADADGNSVAIAIVTIPATVDPTTDDTFGGSVLWNNGGPGVGVAEGATSYGPTLQRMLDGEKHFEMVFFDPRGVGLSTPSARCWESVWARYTDRAWAEDGYMPPLGPGETSFNYRYQAILGLGELCAQGGPDDIMAHMSTASVARDMIAITERAEEERRGGNFSVSALPESQKPRVQFMGSSYGSYLGNTFVSMFPGRTGRILLDAIVDPVDWTEGDFVSHLSDTEEVYDYMYQRCFEDETCPLKLDSDNGPEDIRARVHAFMDELDRSPRYAVQHGRVHVITREMLSRVLISPTYAPQFLWRPFATRLHAAMTDGDFSPFLNLWLLDEDEREAACHSADEEPAQYPTLSSQAEAAWLAVSCGDSYRGDRNVSWVRDLVDTSLDLSPTTGLFWSATYAQCAGWAIDPVYRFTGPFTSPEANACSSDAPQAPVLALSLRLDTAGPLRNAVAITHNHPGSSLVIQEGAGHGTLSFPNKCVEDIVRTYFNDGTVPANGTVCDEEDPYSSMNVDLSARDALEKSWGFSRRSLL